ncbi:hypothetical protein IW492_05920 [Enterococcus sp. BWB1-3]|uniref:phage tail protein n=1 Tax=Enterococcus sp. BWB1-3 TaxID=2787713 RepID=UPI0019232D6B|nr:hypothetical protein [Enterococcus sp. BWB1-3]MBL1228769.1 hypothetical protein [Enterococcus sp. BWB1-3]
MASQGQLELEINANGGELDAIERQMLKMMQAAAKGMNIKADGSGAMAVINKLDGALTNMAKTAASITFKGLAVGGAAAVGGLMASVKAAGELEQQIGGSEAVFGEFANTIQKQGAEAYNKLGLSQSAYLQTANKMGALMKGSGIEGAQGVELTTKAMQRAADVASIMGVDVDAAMESVAGAAKGNFTMMDNLGVAIDDTKLNYYALEKGIGKTTKEMTQAEKVTLAMEMFLDKSSYAAGNYAKENATLAGSFQTLKGAFGNFLATGEGIDAVVESALNFGGIAMKMAAELAPKLAKGLMKAFDTIKPMIPGLLADALGNLAKVADSIFGTNFFSSIPKNIEKAVKEGAKLLDSLFGTDFSSKFGDFKLKMPDFDSLVNGAKKVGLAFVAMFAVVKGLKFASVLKGMGNPLKSLGSQASSTGSAMTGAFKGAFNIQAAAGFAIVIATVTVAIIALAAARDMVIPFLEGLAGVVVKLAGVFPVLATALSMLSPLVIAFGQAFAIVIAAVADAAAKLIPVLTKAFTTIVPIISEALETIVPIVAEAFATMMPHITEFAAVVLPILTEAFNQLVQIIADAMVQISAALGDNFVQIVQIVSDGAVQLVEAFQPIGDNIQAIIEALAPVIESLGNNIQSIVEVIAPVISEIIELFQNLLDEITPILEGIGDVIEEIGDAIVAVVDSISSGISGILDSIAGIFESMGNAALNAGKGIEKMANGIKTLVDLKLGDLVGTLAAVGNALGDFAKHSGAMEKLGSGMKKLADSITTIQTAAASLGVSMLIVMASFTGIVGIVPSITSALTELKTQVETTAPAFTTFAETALASMATLAGISVFTSMAVKAFTELSQGILSSTIGFITLMAIMSSITSSVTSFNASLSTLGTTVSHIISMLGSLVSIFSSTISIVGSLVSALSNLIHFIGITKNKIENLASAFRISMIAMATATITATQMIIVAFRIMSAAVVAVVRVMISQIQSLLNSLPGIFSSALSASVSAVNGYQGAFRSAGSNLGAAIASGIASSVNSIMSVIDRIANQASSRIASAVAGAKAQANASGLAYGTYTDSMLVYAGIDNNLAASPVNIMSANQASSRVETSNNVNVDVSGTFEASSQPVILQVDGQTLAQTIFKPLIKLMNKAKTRR